MLRLALLSFTFCLALTAVARAGNPIVEGWYADPDVVVFEDRYWVFPTFSAAYEKQVFIDAFSSNDLVTWQKHPRVIDTKAIAWAKKAMWAPSVVKKDGEYFLFFAANDVHEGEVGGIGVGVAKQPGGPYKDHLGKPLIQQIVNGAQPIDQAVFQEPKTQQWYILYGGWGHCNIAKLKDDFTGFIPHADGSTFKEITPEGYVEGPMMFFRNEKVYFMWSEGSWGNASYRVAYARADSIDGPFQRLGTVIEPNPDIATGAGHHSVLKIPDKDEYYILYHRRPKGETAANHRETCIDRMAFNEDGTIKPVTITTDGPEQPPLK